VIVLVDLSGSFWRNWHGTKSDGDAYQVTLEQIRWYVDEYPRTAVCLEGGRCMRFDWFPEYKANREKKPEEAIDSLNAIIEQIGSWGTPLVKCAGYEADDVMATLAKQAWLDEVRLLTSDKDMYQCITDSVRLITSKKTVGPEECVQKFGVRPDQIRDWLALVGDTADNVPGCPGTGPGRARDLLQRFETLDAIRAATDDELLSVRGVGQKTLDGLRSWDPSLAVKLVSLMDDAPVRIEELWSKTAA
jgi:DNA polymerase-1